MTALYKKMILKIAILSCCLVTASQNAIAGNIPAIADILYCKPLINLSLNNDKYTFIYYIPYIV